MEKDYIKIYNDAFSLAETLAEKEILKKFIDFKNNRRNANFAGNKISSDFHVEQKNSEIFQKHLEPLYYLFKNRLQEFPVEYQMDVISETLLPAFSKIHPSDDLSFNDYIKKLATYNARHNIYNDFSNNRDLYFLMFKLNDFSEFFIKGLSDIKYSRMYEKYRKLYYEEPSVKPDEVKIATDKEEETKPNFYNIKDEYYEKFLSEVFYDYLKKKFINEQKTTYNDFLAVFTINHNNHSKKIHFFCTTILASFLLSKLQKEIFYKLNMSNFATSSLITSKGGNLNGNNIAKSKSNKSEMDERIVNKTIEYLKEIKISASKRE
jgi:hypothetical protein